MLFFCYIISGFIGYSKEFGFYGKNRKILIKYKNVKYNNAWLVIKDLNNFFKF